MPIVSSDLVLYASANVPDNDTDTSGGAIDTLQRFDFSPLTATDFVELISSGADTRTATIEGRDAAGTFISEVVTLNGTTVVTSTNEYERILRVELSNPGTGQSVTVRKATGDVLIRTILGGEQGFMAFFRRCTAPGDYYIKGFWRNSTVSGQSILDAVAKEFADPENRITFVLASAINDTGSVVNRLTDPGLTFNNSDKSVPGGTLAPGDKIGIWFKLSLQAGDPDFHSTYTPELGGRMPGESPP
jgi:hypothetical protein